MITLAPQHPARLALGAARVATGQAESVVIRSICEDAVRYSAQSRDLTAEIATDAHYLLERMAAAAADGKVTVEEITELRALAGEIEAEATTGRILSHAG